MGPIQQDLGLSDTQISLLQGPGFVATYVLLSVPIGRLVDTRGRLTIIAGGVAIWSVATAACGLARSFGALFVGRAGVGIGEATLTPAAWSLLADYFPPQRRSLPFSIFLMGPYLGVGAAVQAVTPNRMRGVVVGTYVVTNNVIGLALGPSLVALVTDYVFADPNAVGQSLAIVGTAVAALGIALVARGLAPFRALLASAQRAESPR